MSGAFSADSLASAAIMSAAFSADSLASAAVMSAAAAFEHLAPRSFTLIHLLVPFPEPFPKLSLRKSVLLKGGSGFCRLAGWLNRWLFEHRQGEPWQIWQGGGGLLVVVGGGTVGGPGFGGGGGMVKAGGGAGDPGLKFALGFWWKAGGGAGMPGSCTAAVAAAAELAHESSEGRGK